MSTGSSSRDLWSRGQAWQCKIGICSTIWKVKMQNSDVYFVYNSYLIKWLSLERRKYSNFCFLAPISRKMCQKMHPHPWTYGWIVAKSWYIFKFCKKHLKVHKMCCKKTTQTKLCQNLTLDPPHPPSPWAPSMEHAGCCIACWSVSDSGRSF